MCVNFLVSRGAGDIRRERAGVVQLGPVLAHHALFVCHGGGPDTDPLLWASNGSLPFSHMCSTLCHI